MIYDFIIIGAGPAGISAAVYAKSRGKNVLVLERNKVGGVVGNVSTVTHYSGIIENETGKTFAARLENQARNAGAEISFENVLSVSLKDDIKTIVTTDHTYQAKCVLLANGTTPRKLGIPGETELAGHGIGLNAARDGEKYKDKNIYVVGGADGAIKEAIYLAQYAKKLTIIHFENQLGAVLEFMNKLKQLPNVELKLHSKLTSVSGENHIEKLEITDELTKISETVSDDGCGIFVYAGALPNTMMYTDLTLENGFIPVNERMETAIPGVYAAGDIRVKQVRQVATAVADGAIAAINACAFLG